MRKLREEIEWKEERFTLLSDKVDTNTMADAEMEAALQGLQAGEERKGSNASQAVECCLETMVEQIFAMGTDQAKSKFDALYQKILKRFETPTPPARMPGREEGRRDSENEQEQGRASQQLVSFMPSMYLPNKQPGRRPENLRSTSWKVAGSEKATRKEVEKKEEEEENSEAQKKPLVGKSAKKKSRASLKGKKKI